MMSPVLTAAERADRELEAITRTLWRVHDGDAAIQNRATSTLEDLAVQRVLESKRDWYAFPHGKTTVLRVKSLHVELTGDTIPAWQIEVSQRKHREATVVDLHLWGRSSEERTQLASIAGLLLPRMIEDQTAAKAFMAGLQRAGNRSERKLMALLDMQLHRAAKPGDAPVTTSTQLGLSIGGVS
ncbi:MAG: hypothetical protein AB7V46_15655 [Thermomicrobiales bacterium]